MRMEVVRAKTGIMTRRILTPKEKENARRELLKFMDRMYEKHMKIKTKR